LLRSGHAIVSLSISEIAKLGLTVVPTDDEHGFLEGLPCYTEDVSDENYNRATEFADRLLDLAKDNVILDHWREDEH
jgi:hypothetical protein